MTILTFSYDVKEELCHLKVPSKIQALLELSALAGFNAAVALTADGPQLRFFSEHPDVITRVTLLVRILYRQDLPVVVQQNQGLQLKPIYLTQFGDPILQPFLEESGFDLMGGEVAARADILSRLSNPQNAKAYLRGAFLAAGSIVDPEKSYHLEVLISRTKQIEIFRHVAGVQGLDFKWTDRKDDTVFYMKNSDDISDFLVDIGANKAMLRLENAKAFKEVNNAINRQANAETANYDKLVEASAKQIHAIDLISKTIGLDALDFPLQQVAMARLRNPSASLKELGEGLQPKLGKSGVNHRMKKILKMAEELDSDK